MNAFQKRILPTVIYLGLTSTLLAVYFFYERSLIGFPDGHYTDLDRAFLWLYMVVGIQHILNVFVFVYFGLGYGSRSKWIFFLLFYAGSIFLYFGVDWILRAKLDHGVGG
ncbi:hypothetical protein CH352_11105 [Leptospira hartskeerlii]|uniref:Uncharacterized protein n=1 Tax=Leptospira hartskeerlii TaxID=2023177 RepID=A0A2M9XBS1_9LEPT|nr:hypothetical protein [Leptospira hartskeerlii]PJZ25106.1 hypothetical protein CH357_12910 [Leptospira hartskeerlii]PJZ33499.1 hypothetical protein CH352_11105 [Leptospira hartskeerlii]